MTKKYIIHRNGFEPYKVVISNNKIKIYKRSNLDEIQYDKCIMEITDYIKVFIGEDSKYSEYKGNNILVHYKQNGKNNKYIMIDDSIYSFSIKDEIIDFKSPMGFTSGDPYPYAIGKKNTYLVTYRSFISNTYIKNINRPYNNIKFNGKEFDGCNYLNSKTIIECE